MYTVKKCRRHCTAESGDKMESNNFFDLHIYTNNTEGGNDKVSFLCETAAAKHLRAVAFTDVCDIASFSAGDSHRRLRHSFFDTAKAKKLFCDSLMVLSGIEFANVLFDPQQAARVLLQQEYDIVLSGITQTKEQFDISSLANADKSELSEFTEIYCRELKSVVDNTDFDVLSRIMLPFRGIRTDPSFLLDAFEPVLRALVERERALEIDTRDLIGSEKLRDMYFSIIKLFRSLGGKYVTVGSESYFNEEVGTAIDMGMATAARAGFSDITLFERRIPYTIPIRRN